MSVGEPLEISLGEIKAPDGDQVYLHARLRNALIFTHFDTEQRKLIIEKNATSNFDVGTYQITLYLGESIDGVEMPPKIYVLHLTIGNPIIFEEEEDFLSKL